MSKFTNHGAQGRVWLPLGLGVAALLSPACSGQMSGDQRGGAGGGGQEPTETPPAEAGLGRLDEAQVKACREGFNPGFTQTRRLTRREYDNTIADLLGDTSRPSRDFPSDERRDNFDNNAAYLNSSATLTEQYQKAAETVAANAVKNLGDLLPCDPQADERGCAESFIADFGQRAFRRPLEDEEKSGLKAVFDQGRKTSVENGFALVIEAVLQSAPFLYRIEMGESDAARDGYARLTPFELATRLSYLLWATTPDEELMKAAASGDLSNRDKLRKQVDRLMVSPRAERMFGEFHEQWLGLGDVVALSKDKNMFPAWRDDSMTTLKAELRAFAAHVVRDGGDYRRLLTSEEMLVNEATAAIYGFSDGPSGDEFRPYTPGEGQRAGVMTLGAVLASTAKPNETSPVLRGKFVREQLLCQHLPPPPGDVETKLPEISADATTRERFAQHSTDPACSGCHQLIDPVGLGLEGFDAVGRFRREQNGHPIDATGNLVEADVEGDFDGAHELAAMLAGSQEAKRCMVTNWFRFAYGRSVTDGDACFLHELDARLAGDEGRIETLVRALTEIDAFHFKGNGDASAPKNEETSP